MYYIFVSILLSSAMLKVGDSIGNVEKVGDRRFEDYQSCFVIKLFCYECKVRVREQQQLEAPSEMPVS